MGFLSPVLLALGAAVAVPLILHLFQRHHGPRVVFPALRYLRRAETEHARRIRFRQLLLMLLRVAAIAALAAAAARPFLRSAGAAHQPSAVAIVLDNSMSSSVVIGDRRVLDELKDRALETLGDAEPEDRFWLIRAGSPWEPALPGDAATTARRVRETLPSSGAADLVSTLDRARAVLDAGAEGRAKEIHLLSDLQATNIPTGTATGDWPAIIAWTIRDEPPPNVAVASIEVGGGMPPIAGRRSTIAVSISGDAAADSVNVRLALDERVVAAASAPAGSATILSFPARPAGYVAGWVEKDPDAVRPDDRRYFAARVAPPPALFVAGSLGLVDEAIRVLETAGRLTLGDSRAADIAILPAGRTIDTMTPGQNLIVLPPDSTLDLPSTNRRLASAGIPWQFETADQTGEARIAADSTADATLRTLGSVRISTVYRLARQPGTVADTVLLRLTDGAAWAVQGTRPGGGRYVLFASPFSVDATTLPTSPALLPLLDRLFGAWIVTRPSLSEATPGQIIGLPAGTTAVQDPDGTIESAAGSYRFGGTAGVFSLLAGDSLVGMVAVNPPASESLLARADSRRLRDALGGTPVVTADRPDQWRDRIYRERVGREFWRVLVLVALALLVTEALVASLGASGTGRTGSMATGSKPATPVGARD